jgi:hypothetical protein
MSMLSYQLVSFALLWIVIVYIVNVLIARKFKSVQVKPALLYIFFLAMLGPIGEVFIGSIYNYLFGGHLWDYTLFPIHHGYTSLYSPVIWGIYGFYLYLLADTIKDNERMRGVRLALLLSLETILLEAIVNLTYLLLFGRYLFYYYPADLWHFTSIQTIPFYFLTGFVIMGSMKRFKPDPVFFTLMCVAIMVVFVFLT